MLSQRLARGKEEVGNFFFVRLSCLQHGSLISPSRLHTSMNGKNNHHAFFITKRTVSLICNSAWVNKSANIPHQNYPIWHLAFALFTPFPSLDAAALFQLRPIHVFPHRSLSSANRGAQFFQASGEVPHLLYGEEKEGRKTSHP